MPIKASCHCGAVRFEAPTPVGITRCNCTYCDRVGALWAYCSPDAFRLDSDPADLIPYSPTEGVHYSCRICGMVTHGRSPDYERGDGEKLSYNVRMDVEFDRNSVPITDLDGRHQW